MFARGTIFKLLVLIIAIVVITGLATWLLFDGHFLFLGLAAVTVGMLIWATLKQFSKAMTKATFMFNAIENDDFTFRFSEDLTMTSDRLFNSALNRIREIVGQTRLDIIERERYYEQILSQSSSGIVVVDDKGIVYQVNDAVLGQLGLSSLTHLRQLELISHNVAQAFVNVQPKAPATIMFYNDVEQRQLSITASEATLQKVGRVKIIAVNDVAFQIEDAQLDSWIKMSRVLTHEIMNSLSPVTSLSESLSQTDDMSTIREGLAVISTTSQSLLGFVENFRRFVRIGKPTMRDFVLKDMIVRSAKLFECRDIEVRCPEDLIIMADENLIGQVIVNLLKNGVEATVDGGKIWIKVSRRAGFRVAIEIGNDGAPIADDMRESIFVPFFTTKPSGSGVGLSLSRQIMRLHGGTLTLNSKSACTEFILLF